MEITTCKSTKLRHLFRRRSNLTGQVQNLEGSLPYNKARKNCQFSHGFIMTLLN